MGLLKLGLQEEPRLDRPIGRIRRTAQLRSW
jgi:hypothetical protein